MKFTNEVPTKDGYYLWRFDLSFIPSVVRIENGYTEAGNLPPEMSGEWCRLVPAEEVHKAFEEGYKCSVYDEGTMTTTWECSDAKRVMEGTP